MLDGAGTIDLGAMRLCIKHNGREYCLRLHSESECLLTISDGAGVVFCGFRKLADLRNSEEADGLLSWLARGFAGVPVRYKEAAFAKAGKR